MTVLLVVANLQKQVSTSEGLQQLLSAAEQYCQERSIKKIQLTDFELRGNFSKTHRESEKKRADEFLKKHLISLRKNSQYKTFHNKTFEIVSANIEWRNFEKSKRALFTHFIPNENSFSLKRGSKFPERLYTQKIEHLAQTLEQILAKTTDGIVIQEKCADKTWNASFPSIIHLMVKKVSKKNIRSEDQFLRTRSNSLWTLKNRNLLQITQESSPSSLTLEPRARKTCFTERVRKLIKHMMPDFNKAKAAQAEKKAAAAAAEKKAAAAAAAAAAEKKYRQQQTLALVGLTIAVFVVSAVLSAAEAQAAEV